MLHDPTGRGSRQKSCIPCAKAKRRCSPQSPKCPRCAEKGLSCVYKNMPAKCSPDKLEDVDKHVELSNNSPLADEATISEIWLQDDQFFPETLASFSPPYSAQDFFDGSSWLVPDPDLVFSATMNLSSLVEDPVEKWYMDSWAKNIIRGAFKSQVMMFAKHQGTPFIHPRLYDAFLPDSIADAFAVSTAYCTRSKDTEIMALRVVEKKTRQLLLQDTTTWNIDEHLASVQSLLVLCLILIHEGDSPLRSFSEEAMGMLDVWNTSLRDRLMGICRSNCWQSWLSWHTWIWAESANRTILFSLYMMGFYSAVTRGYCHNVPKMRHMSFTWNTRLWDCQTEAEWRAAAGEAPPRRIEYGDLTLAFMDGQLEGRLDKFHKLLLAPCLGEKFKTALQIEDEL